MHVHVVVHVHVPQVFESIDTSGEGELDLEGFTQLVEECSLFEDISFLASARERHALSKRLEVTARAGAALPQSRLHGRRRAVCLVRPSLADLAQNVGLAYLSGAHSTGAW